MDPEDYAKKGVDKVYPKYNWMPSTGVQRGNVKSSPIRGDPQTPGYPSVGKKTIIFVLLSLHSIYSTRFIMVIGLSGVQFGLKSYE